MKKTHYGYLLGMVAIMSLVSCGKSATVDLDNIVFARENLVQSSYGGLGVEMGVYEDTDRLSASSQERIIANMQKLNPVRIRCMISFDWFVDNFDNKGDEDKNNDTWTYNFANKWGANLDLLLTYCQEHNIEVAFGSWNVVGTLTDDVWNMMDDCSSDPRWAKMNAHVLDYLVNQKGYTCIRWVINGNEPNYLGIKGSSKNWNNSLEKWIIGATNVRAALDAKGLNAIGIVGGDTTGLEGTEEYWTGIATQIPDKVADYGAHLYLSNYYIDGGQVLEAIHEMNKKMIALDPGYGTQRPINIWESGLLDGKNAATDGNALIKTVTYGVRMADFTIQTALGGVNSVTYWDFDDAMHFMYSGGIVTPKRWGMFSSLASDQAYDQELRPWFHSSSLMTNLMRPESRIYGSPVNDPELNKDFRVIGVVNKDATGGGIVAVNRGIATVNKTFVFDETITGADKLYIYKFGEGTIRLGEDGYIIPNYVIDGSLNKRLSVNMAANSLLIVTTEAL